MTVTSATISYERLPYQESDTNPYRKWRYKTDSPIFRQLFSQAAGRIPEVMSMEEEWATDIGATSFIIKYDDRRKVSHEFYLPGSSFADLFRIFRQMVPGIEDTPSVLTLSED